MKILYDHQTYIIQEYGGVSRYFYELSKGLKNLNVDVANSVLLSNSVYTAEPMYRSFKFLPSFSFKGKGTLIRLIDEWYSKTALNNKFDIFHPTYYSTYFLNSLQKKPFVITVYDLIHEKFAESFGELATDKDLFKTRGLLFERASKIIAISNSTKNDIIDIYKIPSSKIDVIYLGSSLKEPDETPRHNYNDYILYVGRRNSYKNFELFVNALAPLLLKETGLKIICAGGGKFTSDEINLFNRLKIKDHIIQVSIDDELLAALYNKALFFVFPSKYEGFGIPVLEAFGCSCPSILSNRSSLPEVGGDAALYFNPDDKDELFNAAYTMLYDTQLRSRLKQAGYERQKLFSWEKTTRHHYEVYNSIL